MLLNAQELPLVSTPIEGSPQGTDEYPIGFYRSISVPASCISTATYMRHNGCTIERGYVQGWDKNFANPMVPWTLPISETDDFVDQHKEWITIQLTMETVFFETEQQIMLEYLIGSLWGLNWKNVLLCARDTVRDYFRKNNVTGTAQMDWWISLQARGLPIAVDPNSGIDLDTVTVPPNPLGSGPAA